jgi:hypothetical protein
VADLVENEKLACRSGTDLSLKLIALAHYVSEPTWSNALGEPWSIERMVREELKRPVDAWSQAAVTRLLALSFALDRRAHLGLPLEGAFATAKEYVGVCQEYVLRAQNSDGSWGRVYGGDEASALASSAGVLQWLVLSLPEKRLEEPKIVQAVRYVDGQLGAQRYQGSIPALSSREMATVMTAVNALRGYDAQVFVPADPLPAAPAAPVAPAAQESQAAETP